MTMTADELYDAINQSLKRKRFYNPKMESSEFNKLSSDVLIRAVLLNNYDVVDYFVNCYAIPKSEMKLPMVINYALSIGNVKMAKFIMETYKHTFGNTDTSRVAGLHQAALKGHLESVKFILESKGIEKEYIQKAVPDLLDLASSGGHKHVVDYISSKKFIDTKALVKLEPEIKGIYNRTTVVTFLLAVIASIKVALDAKLNASL